MPVQGREVDELPISHWIEVTREALETLDNRLGRADPELSSSQFRGKLEKAIAFIQAITSHPHEQKTESRERDDEEQER